MSRRLTAFFVLFGIGFQAHAFAPWVNRHNACRDHLALITSPGKNSYADVLTMDTIPYEKAAHDAFGSPNAFVGTNGTRVGLWITGNAKSYFVELPQPMKSAPGTIWMMRVKFPDGRPPLLVRLQSMANIANNFTSINVTAFDERHEDSGNGFYDLKHATAVDAHEETSPEAKQQSADSLIQRLEDPSNIFRLQSGFDEVKDAVQACVADLDPQDPDDKRILSALKIRTLPRTDNSPRSYEPIVDRGESNVSR